MMLMLEHGGGGDGAGVFEHLQLQQPFGREMGPPQQNSMAMFIWGVLPGGHSLGLDLVW